MAALRGRSSGCNSWVKWATTVSQGTESAKLHLRTKSIATVWCPATIWHPLGQHNETGVVESMEVPCGMYASPILGCLTYKSRAGNDTTCWLFTCRNHPLPELFLRTQFTLLVLFPWALIADILLRYPPLRSLICSILLVNRALWNGVLWEIQWLWKNILWWKKVFFQVAFNLEEPTLPTLCSSR